MPRIRSLKIGFFTNEELCELSPWHRLLFAGLWLLADRDGRLEDRPRRIKAALFPYDEVDVHGLLTELAAKGFVVRYTADGAGADGARYLAIPTFHLHQRPRYDEIASVIPAVTSPSRPRDATVPDPTLRSDGSATPRCTGSGEGNWDLGTEEGKGIVVAVARLSVDDFVALWNAHTLPPIGRCSELTSSRRRHVKARLEEHTLAEWMIVFDRIQASAFCRGENDRGWHATFDWVCGSPDVAVKVLEGKYDDRVAAIPHHQTTKDDARMFARLTPFQQAKRAGLK